jgi:hypothetical protein
MSLVFSLYSHLPHCYHMSLVFSLYILPVEPSSSLLSYVISLLPVQPSSALLSCHWSSPCTAIFRPVIMSLVFSLYSHLRPCRSLYLMDTIPLLRLLATAFSEKCYQTELNAWNWIEQRKLRKRQRDCNAARGRFVNSQATEQVSLLAVALQRSFLVSSCSNAPRESLASLDGKKGWWSC